MEYGLLSVHQFPVALARARQKKKPWENIKEAIALCLEVRAEQGMPLIIETWQVEVAA